MTTIWIFLLLHVAPVIEAEVETSRSHHNDDNTIVANDLQSNYEGELLPRDVRASDDVISVSHALHLDVLRHSISYLRERLLTCLRSHSKNGMRHQRMARSSNLSHDVDINILENTISFLMSQIVRCRTEPEVKPNVHTDVNSRESIQTYLTTIAQLIPTHNILPATETTTMPTPFKINKKKKIKEINLHKKYAESTPYQNRRKLHQKASIETKMKRPAVQPVYRIEVKNNNITCEEATLTHSNTILTCRNLWINNKYRLPNRDLCPPTYDPSGWKSVDTIRPEATEVIDLVSLCDVIAGATKLQGIVQDARVCWDCDVTTDRLIWQHGGWAGLTRDNGYLRDLQCIYRSFKTRKKFYYYPNRK